MKKIVGITLTSLSLFMPKMAKADPDKKTCKAHISEQEKAKGIEPGLLEAIALIESKLNPHVVNACGRAHHFKSTTEAANFVKKKQQEGVRNISVGPMQLHVPSHRHNFKTLEAMIDPKHNIEYAAKLFKRLKRQTGSTEAAVKLYHSPNPEANEAYKTRVFGAWAKIRKSKKPAKVIDIKAQTDSCAGKTTAANSQDSKMSSSLETVSRKKS